MVLAANNRVAAAAAAPASSYLFKLIPILAVVIIVAALAATGVIAHNGGTAIFFAVFAAMIGIVLVFAQGGDRARAVSVLQKIEILGACLVVIALVCLVAFYSSESWFALTVGGICAAVAVRFLIGQMLTRGPPKSSTYGGLQLPVFLKLLVDAIVYVPCAIVANLRGGAVVLSGAILTALVGVLLVYPAAQSGANLAFLLTGMAIAALGLAGALGANLPGVQFVIDCVAYLPCLIFPHMKRLQLSAITPASRATWTLLVLEVLVIALWLVYPLTARAFLTRGGRQLVDEPVPLSPARTLATYDVLNPVATEDTMKSTYNYAISFWTFFDAVPPSYTKYATVLSYGNTPVVEYNARLNRLRVTAARSDDETGQRVIWELDGVRLQRWNHMVVNMSGGTMDVFYNGELVKSAIEVVPYRNFDPLVVGAEGGVLGKIANVMYYSHTLTGGKIAEIWREFKDVSPPTGPRNRDVIGNFDWILHHE